MPAPSFLAGLPKPILFGLYGAIGGLLGAVLLGEPAWRLLEPKKVTQAPELAIGASPSVKLYPGSENKFVILIKRERFDKPVTVKFGNLPPGMTIPSLTIPPGVDQIEASVAADSKVPVGITKVTFDASAEGVAAPPTGSIDIEVIVPPSALALAVPKDLAVYANGTGIFTASVARRGYDGEIAIAVQQLPAGVTAAPVSIPAGGSDVQVTLSAAATAALSSTPYPLKVTASATSSKVNATASTQLDVKKPPLAPVDIVFVLDVTSSIQFALDDLKNGIGKFAEGLSKSQGGIDFRLGLVTFQDITIPGEKIEVINFDGSPFTSNSATFREKVGQLKAEGGGDIPESSLEGIAEALKLPFRQGATRILLLITDAPPKVKPGQTVPQTEREQVEATKKTAAAVKTQGIDSVHLIVQKYDFNSYKPLLEAGTAKKEGMFFDLKDVLLGYKSFDEIFSTFGEAVTAAAIARGSDVKPQIANAPDPPKVPGGTEALKSSEAPPPPSIKGVQASGSYAADSSGQLTLAIGVWTGAIAAMLCLALLSGQHHYLRGQFPPVIRALAGFAGGLVVGIVGGAAGEGLYLQAQISVFQILGWTLLGGLAGLGLSLFIPNLKWFYGLAGGAVGGAVGGVGYMFVASLAGDLVGRLVGGLLVGFCIGLMVAIVEAAFRRAWLEVRFGARETISVNLGPEPVKVGGDAKLCTVWARGAAPLALRFFIRDGQVICDDAVMKRESSVADGFAKEVGNVTVTVRTGSGSTAPSPQPVRVPVPAAKAAASPVSKAPIMDDDFDGLPMAKSPPPPTPVASHSKPAMPQMSTHTPPEVSKGGTRPSSPPTPPVATPPAPPAYKPPSPAPTPPVSKPPMPSAPSKPPAPPAPGASKPPMPSAPTPPKAASPPPAPPPPSASKHPDACPSCGRVNAGKVKTRYCMVCDRTY